MEFLSSGPIASLWAVILLAVVVWLCSRWGGLWLNRLGLGSYSEITAAESALFCVALGLVSLGALVWVVGIFGYLYAGVFLFILFVMGAMNLGGENLWRRSSIFFLFDFGPSKMISATLLFVFFLSAVQALAPPTSMDALAYHLDHPKQFIQHHRIEYLPLSRESLWPYLTEMFFTLGLLLDGTGLAQLFHWLFYVLSVLAVYLLSKRLAGSAAAGFAALVFLLTPSIFEEAGQAYVDLSFTFFVLMALYPFILYLHKPSRILVFLSGLWAGAACGTKYLGLGSAFILFFFWWVCTRRFTESLRYSATAFAAGGFWYIRSWVVSGNPFYPFFPTIFGGHGYETYLGGADIGMGNNLIAAVQLLWNLTFYPGAFGGPAIGPFYLMLLPLLTFSVSKKIKPEIKYLALFAFLFAFFIMQQSQQSRFFIPVLAVLAIGAGAVWAGILKEKGFIRNLCAILLLSIVVFHLALFGYRTRYALAPVLGKVSVREYLSTRERSFKAYSYLTDSMRAEDSLFSFGEPRHFYSPRSDMLFDSPPLRAELERKGLTLQEYLLKQRFTYVLVDETESSQMARFLSANGYKKVYSYSFTEKAEFPYTIFHLSD